MSASSRLTRSQSHDIPNWLLLVIPRKNNLSSSSGSLSLFLELRCWYRIILSVGRCAAANLQQQQQNSSSECWQADQGKDWLQLLLTFYFGVPEPCECECCDAEVKRRGWGRGVIIIVLFIHSNAFHCLVVCLPACATWPKRSGVIIKGERRTYCRYLWTGQGKTGQDRTDSSSAFCIFVLAYALLALPALCWSSKIRLLPSMGIIVSVHVKKNMAPLPCSMQTVSLFLHAKVEWSANCECFFWVSSIVGMQCQATSMF